MNRQKIVAGNWKMNNDYNQTKTLVNDLIQIVNKDKEIAKLDVWLGKKDQVKVYINENVYKTIPKARKRYLKVVINYDGPIEAPVIKIMSY